MIGLQRAATGQGCCRALARTTGASVPCMQRPRSSRARMCTVSVVATWSRPMPDRDQDFVKPSYVPQPSQRPEMQPYRQREEGPLYAPSAPEFTPAERPDNTPEMPAGPKMPERGPDPIPAGNPKEKPGTGEPEKREAPPEK